MLGLWAVREETPMGRCQRTDSVLFLLSSTSVSASASLLPIAILQSCTSHLIQHCSGSRRQRSLALPHHPTPRYVLRPFGTVLQNVTTSQSHLLKQLSSFFPSLTAFFLFFIIEVTYNYFGQVFFIGTLSFENNHYFTVSFN